MGHGPSDETYWLYYLNRTSTFDFQAHAYGTVEQDISVLSSIFLNSKSDAP